MEYLFSIGMPGKTLGLGIFQGEDREGVLNKIKSLIVSGSFLPGRETAPFHIERLLYDGREKVIERRYASLEIILGNGGFSISTNWLFKEESAA